MTNSTSRRRHDTPTRGGTIPIPKITVPVPLGILEELEPELESKELKRNRFPIPNSSFHQQAEGNAIHDS